jgi:hypothetical protein
MVLVDVVRRRRVGPWRSQIVLRLVLPPGSASIINHWKVISHPGRGRDCPGEYKYIVAVRSIKWSTSDIGRENAPQFLLLVRMHTSLSVRH